MPIAKEYRNDKEIQKALADAWLNIQVDDDLLPNPLDWPDFLNDSPEEYIAYVMSQPDYFAFVCKEILNVTISPTQAVILRELWNRKFPMYIASRGFGKALLPETSVRVPNGWKAIKDIGPGDKVYAGDGSVCNVTDVSRLQKNLLFYRLTFQDGRTIDCCEDHQWKIWDARTRKWVVYKTKDMLDSYFWEKKKPGRLSTHYEYRYAIPLCGEISDKYTNTDFFPVKRKEAKEFLELTFLTCEETCRAQNYYLAKGLYVKKVDKSIKIYGLYLPTSAYAKSNLEKVFITNIEYVGKRDGVCIMVDSKDSTYVTKDYIVTHNSFLLGVYCILRLLFMPSRKVIIAGAAFRQSKVIFEYMETIFNNAPLLRDLMKGGSNGPRRENDMYRFFFNESSVTAIPIGTGQKIRGLRANDLICDEMNSISREIFETVLVGFTAVSSKPIENQQEAARKNLAKLRGWWQDDVFDTTRGDNQLVISGTAGYAFQHFFKYWRDWHDIVASRGDKRKLENYFARRSQDSGMEIDDISKQLDWEDYSIIRIPFDLIPEGFMDTASVARARATMHSGTYQSEYGAVFSNDSNGFFKRSLIENCSISINNKINFPSCGEVFFEAMLFGAPDKNYVFGVDPASEVDNFAIVIVELNKEHRRIVYSWTINKMRHRQEVKQGLSEEQDYYSYCARKIRNLMRRFPCVRIMLDSQGGGYALLEKFREKRGLEEDEMPILPVINPDKPEDSDMLEGLHLVELVNFRDNKWLGEANNGMRKDFEDKILLFPYFDAISLVKAENYDETHSHINDSLEDVVNEIHELKDELSNIVQTQTPSGLDKWDTPEEVLPGGKKGRMRKDRYSALLMANMGARIIMADKFFIPFESWGGLSRTNKETKGDFYTNPFFSNWAKDFYDID